MCKVEFLLIANISLFIINLFINNNKHYGDSVFLTSGCFQH